MRKIRFHDLRHSCASLLLSRGIPMKAIQEWLGHSNFSTTANLYAHLDVNSKIMSAQTMADIINKQKKYTPNLVSENISDNNIINTDCSKDSVNQIKNISSVLSLMNN